MHANWILTNVVVDPIAFTKEGEYTAPWYMTWVEQGDPMVKHITSGLIMDEGFQVHCQLVIECAREAIKTTFPNRHVDGKNALTRLSFDDFRTTVLRSINAAGLDEFAWVESDSGDVETSAVFNRLREHMEKQREQLQQCITETV